MTSAMGALRTLSKEHGEDTMWKDFPHCGLAELVFTALLTKANYTCNSIPINNFLQGTRKATLKLIWK